MPVSPNAGFVMVKGTVLMEVMNSLQPAAVCAFYAKLVHLKIYSDVFSFHGTCWCLLFPAVGLLPTTRWSIWLYGATYEIP